MTRPEWEVFDALKSLGVDDGKALAAAQAMALTSDRITAIDKEIYMLRWMVGTNIAITLAVLGLVLSTMVHA